MKIKTLFFFLLFALFTTTIYAEDPTMLNITFSTNLPVMLDSEGNVSVASGIQITNNGDTDIRISSAMINSENNWELVDENVDLSKEYVGSKKYSFSIQGVFSSSSGECLLDEIISAFSTLTLEYSTNIAPQCNDVNEEIASVVFTFENIPNEINMFNQLEENQDIYGIENIQEQEPIYTLDDFYTYNLNSERGVYILELTSDFYDALYNQSSYLDWNYGTPLPNPYLELEKEFPIVIINNIFNGIDYKTLDLSKWDGSLIETLDNLTVIENLNENNNSNILENVRISENTNENDLFIEINNNDPENILPTEPLDKTNSEENSLEDNTDVDNTNEKKDNTISEKYI